MSRPLSRARSLTEVHVQEPHEEAGKSMDDEVRHTDYGDDTQAVESHAASARFDPARRRRVGLELSLVLSGKWPMSCVNPSVLANSGLKRWQPVSMERGPNS